MKRIKERWLIFSQRFLSFTPIQKVACGYLLYVLAVFILLCLPVSNQKAGTALVDHLFTAASAVSTTGLATVGTSDSYTFWGQLVILLGIQAGGLGYMTLGSFLILASAQKLTLNRARLSRAVFALPRGFRPIRFVRRAVVFTLLLEALGAWLLYQRFSQVGISEPVWAAIFHSVSAFCTAGFSIFPDSLESLRGDWVVNLVVSTLSLSGALGFIVISDLWLKVRDRKRPVTLTSKIILSATFGGIFVGTIGLFFDSSLGGLPLGDRFLAAFFQSMTALTTVGFNTVPVGNLSTATLLLVLLLMIMGASPSGTGGGLKSTTWSAGLAVTWSALRGRKTVTFFGNRVPDYRIQGAFAAFTLYLVVFAAGSFLLLATDSHHFEDVVFETASALGTVGLSRGITGDLSLAGKFIVILLMFIGRVGVVSLGLAAMAPRPADEVLEDGEPRNEEDFVI